MISWTNLSILHVKVTILIINKNLHNLVLLVFFDKMTLLPLELKWEILKYMNHPNDYLMATYALESPHDTKKYNDICGKIGVYPKFIKIHDIRDSSKLHLFMYTREIDPSSGKDVQFTNIYLNSVIGVDQCIIDDLKNDCDNDYLALNIVIDECIYPILVKYYKFLRSEIDKKETQTDYCYIYSETEFTNNVESVENDDKHEIL